MWILLISLLRVLLINLIVMIALSRASSHNAHQLYTLPSFSVIWDSLAQSALSVSLPSRPLLPILSLSLSLSKLEWIKILLHSYRNLIGVNLDRITRARDNSQHRLHTYTSIVDNCVDGGDRITIARFQSHSVYSHVYSERTITIF